MTNEKIRHGKDSGKNKSFLSITKHHVYETIGTGFGDQKTSDSTNLSCVFVRPWRESSSKAIFFFFLQKSVPRATDDSTRVSAFCHLPLYCCGCCKLKIHFRIGGNEIQH